MVSASILSIVTDIREQQDSNPSFTHNTWKTKFTISCHNDDEL